MAEERPPKRGPGDGPYRTVPLFLRERRSWLPWAIGAGLAALAVLVAVLWPRGSEAPPSVLPLGAFDLRAWPPPEPELGPSTPLAPLLVADRPEALAVMAPGEGASRLRRGETLWVRFNRPMVSATEVGRPTDRSPLVFDPPLEGVAQWTSRSSVSFAPHEDAFDGVREVRLSFVEGLAALSGEPLADDLERVVVLDGAPRVLAHRSQGRVLAGAPLPLVFDAPVDVAALRRELLAYEVGGGQRTLPIALGGGSTELESGYRVDVRLARALEPGAQIALALAPRYQPWGGSSPAVMQYELAPRPFIEGIACDDGAAQAGQCAHGASPGAVIDIGPSLRLLASARLADASAANVRVVPALRALSVRLAPHGPPQRRLIEIGGEWEPDQVYEVRVVNLRTEEGQPVRPLPPLAVRSQGSPPQIQVATGTLAYERDAEPVLHFSAIHPEPSDVLLRSVAPGDELRALVSPELYVRDSATALRLAGYAPDARANRWGRGRLPWRAADQSMSVVAFRPDASRAPRDVRAAFVQSTDLGVTVRASAEELLVWVTSLSSGGPVRDASVTVADAEAREIARGRTDRHGVARIALEASPLFVSHAVRVVRGDDRAAILLDPRAAVIPAGMGLTPGAAAPDDAPIATVFTDRGAYRPGEGIHAKLVLRTVEGPRASAVRSGRYVVRLFAPGAVAPIAEQPVQPSRFGTAAVDFELPRASALGDWRIAVARADRDESLGEAALVVAEFRQPTFRVDLTPIDAVLSGAPIASEASATYLFGAPVTRGHVRWSLVRSGLAAYPERWSRYRFTPVGSGSPRGTIAEGDVALEADGRVRLEGQAALLASARTNLVLEAEVTDGAGHTHAARRSFVAYPAAVEVGLLGGGDWIAHGEALDIEAIAIDRAGELVPGHTIEARVVREGWHSWWEWSESGEESIDGSYQMRRDQRREVVHACRITSALAPSHCEHTPARPGTYVLEVEARDAEGRVSLASRRVYVAGPDEAPDRDPPGAPIAVTPVRARWTVGQTAELAFESPFERAEALITVEREGVMRVERRSVGAGGQVIRVPITAEMVPNVFVGVTLVRPRTGPPRERVDLEAPDLRFGIAELAVSPATSDLNVTIELAASARPGTEVPVSVRVTDARGRPVQGEVALWAVDEGTLRLTGYQVPDPTDGLFRPRPAAFAWHDLRRALVSRVEPPPLPLPGGDGNDGEARPRTLDDRERFDPTPLWAPQLVTDAQGRASATIVLPARPTEYRVMAVALDAGARSGAASAQLVAEQPLVIRPAFPRFATGGDRFEASVFVHNATDAELRARVRATIGGERRAARTIVIPAGGEVRVAEPVLTPEEGPLALRFDASANGERTAVADEIPVAPRGRFVRSHAFGAARSSRVVEVGLPEGTPRTGAHVNVVVASHPFVGLESAVLALDDGWSGTEALASSLLGLCAYAGLELPDRNRGLTPEEQEARGRTTAARLLDQRNADGGFGRWSSVDSAMPGETALAFEALHCAAERGWIERGSIEGTREALIALANGAAFGDWYGEAGLDANAHALRVLADAGAPQTVRADALYEQRERLSPYGLAELAMAVGEEDSRAETLLFEAARTVLADRDGEADDPSVVRWNDHGAHAYAPVLEAASRFEFGHRHAGPLAARLLGAHGRSASEHPWGGGRETARAIRALAAYSRLFQWEPGEGASVQLDGEAIRAASRSRSGAYFALPVPALRGRHDLRIAGGGGAPVFFAIDGRWAVPIGAPDTIARGRRVAVHRVYETPDGRRIEDGASVPLGAMVRVRLFVHTEEASPEIVALRDPLPAGFEAVDAGHDTNAHTSLVQLMGTSPDDEVIDGRAHHAMRSLSSIAHRSFDTDATSFFFDRLPSGLAEYTYAIRATTVGEFTVPPAEVEALRDLGFVARSTMCTMRVTEHDE